MNTGEPDATEIGHVRFGGGPSEKDQVNWHLVGGLPYRTSGSGSGSRKSTGGNTDRALRADFHHNFLNLPGSVGDMLAEARGYHFSMVLAHQNLTQMPRETQMALSANARNKIFFSCAPEDAHQLGRHTMPELDEHDLSHMDAFRAAARSSSPAGKRRRSHCAPTRRNRSSVKPPPCAKQRRQRSRPHPTSRPRSPPSPASAPNQPTPTSPDSTNE